MTHVHNFCKSQCVSQKTVAKMHTSMTKLVEKIDGLNGIPLNLSYTREQKLRQSGSLDHAAELQRYY